MNIAQQMNDIAGRYRKPQASETEIILSYIAEEAAVGLYHRKFTGRLSFETTKELGSMGFSMYVLSSGHTVVEWNTPVRIMGAKQ